MTRRSGSRRWIASALFGCFCGGIIVGWQIRGGAPSPASGSGSAAVSAPAAAASDLPEADRAGQTNPAASAANAVPRTNDSAVETARTAEPQSAIDALRARDLRMPIDGADVESMRGGFDERRDAGARPHEAADLLAPRNTPVHAVDNGSIAKLFVSKAGGNTIYQFDPGQRFCYYYAHLDRYADGLRDGAPVTRGDVIGFVGTSGNAPANTPHLHFALFELTPEHHWWQGTPLDPYLVFRR